MTDSLIQLFLLPGFGFLHPLQAYVPSYLSLSDGAQVGNNENEDGKEHEKDEKLHENEYRSKRGIGKEDKEEEEQGNEENKEEIDVEIDLKGDNGRVSDVDNNKNTENIKNDRSDRNNRNSHKIAKSPFYLNITESPYWPERSFHIHTQHPLELTDVLQGHDIPQVGLHGPHCGVFSYQKRDKYSKRSEGSNSSHSSDGGGSYDGSNGDVSVNANSINNEYSGNGRNNKNSNKNNPQYKIPYCERWEDMVEDVSKLFEWSVANRLNRVEWLLLGSYKWGDELETR